MSSMLAHAHALLRDVFGYERIRAPQDEVIATLMAGGDALELMPTGGGPSLCYQSPAPGRPASGFVASPLSALLLHPSPSLNLASGGPPFFISRRLAGPART